MAHAEGLYVLIAITALIGVVLATPWCARRMAFRVHRPAQFSQGARHADATAGRFGDLRRVLSWRCWCWAPGFVSTRRLAFCSVRHWCRLSVASTITVHRSGAKLLAQALAAGILIFSGVQVAVFDQQWLNVVVTVIWVVGITNALNFLDNMDGLSAGAAAVASAFFCCWRPSTTSIWWA